MSDIDRVELIDCERRAMRLTSAGCARLWTSAQEARPEPWEGRSACRTCPLGAARAGRPLPPNAAAAELLRRVCPRCLRQAQRLINGLHCVSCYNREAECRRGRDRKGNRPGLLDRLRASTIVITRGASSSVEQHAEVVSATEAMLIVAKTAAGRICFGWAPRSNE